MPNIHVLPFAVANLIAAGEVVDRPSSVIKELLENAIDAGADQVTVEIQNGGVRFMRVTDNGCGMAPEDLPVALQRHATSKIRTASDLDGIATLGFRGEALAAISSVSRVRLLSKQPESEMGALLECHGGEIVSHTEAGCPNGTTIIVEDLFYNVPARRKFLKKDATEAIACATVVEKIALSHPEIALRYISDGDTKFRTTGNGELSGVLYALFGRDIAKRSLWTDRTENGVRVYGYVSEPDLFRPNRNLENFFINGRYVKSRTANAAVEQAYSSKIPHDKFPICVLNIGIAPGAVDVNVHPTKLEVKFTNEKLVFDAIYYAVQNALEAAANRPELTVSPAEQLSMTDKSHNATPNVPFTGTPKKNDKNNFWVSGDEAKRLMNAFVPVDAPREKHKQISLRDANTAPTPTAPKTPMHEAPMLHASATPEPKDWQHWRNMLHSIGAIEAPAVEDVPQPPPEMIVPPTPMEETPVNRASFDDTLAQDTLRNNASGNDTSGNDTSWNNASGNDASFMGQTIPVTPPIVETSPLPDAPSFAPEDIPQIENGIPVGGIPVPPNVSGEDESAPNEPVSDTTAETEPSENVNDPPEYLILGEAFNTYILVQLEDRLLLIDKHAAHERIIFDELCRRMHDSVPTGQLLLSPYPLTLLQSEADMLTEYGDSLHAIGFQWESTPATLSTATIQLTQIPDTLTIPEGTALFTDLVTRLADATATVESASAAYFETRLWQASCKAAIKGGRIYDRVHLEWLCDRLLVRPEKEGASVIRTCPHGRPVAFEIKKTSIERQFARLT